MTHKSTLPPSPDSWPTPKTVRIVVLAGKTFRGTFHFEETKYDASTELAAYAVREGVARLA